MTTSERAALRDEVNRRRRAQLGIEDEQVPAVIAQLALERDTRNCVVFTESDADSHFGRARSIYLSKATYAKLGCPNNLTVTIANANALNR